MSFYRSICIWYKLELFTCHYIFELNDSRYKSLSFKCGNKKTYEDTYLIDLDRETAAFFTGVNIFRTPTDTL